MNCEKCGRDFSMKVWRVHKDRCNSEKEKDVQAEGLSEEEIAEVSDESTKEEIIAFAESKGVDIDKRWSKTRILRAIYS